MRSMLCCAVLGLVIFAAWAPSAQACTAEYCPAPVRLFSLASPTDVRGNLVYFKVLKDDPGPLTLRVKGGDVIPSSIRMIGKDRVFAPNDPIAPGTEVQLEYTTSCGAQTFDFTTYEHADVAVRDATLAIDTLGVAAPGDRYNEAGFVELRYADPENGEAYYLVDRKATIDGKPVGIDREGRIMVSSYCDPEKNEYISDSCAVTRFVPIGEHTVEVRASIVGLASDPPPVKIKVRTACSVLCDGSGTSGMSSGQSGADRGVAYDAGAETDEMSSAGRASEAPKESAKDYGKPNAGHTAIDPVRPAADGCSASRGTAGGHAPAWAIMFALAALLRARRAREQR